MKSKNRLSLAIHLLLAAGVLSGCAEIVHSEEGPVDSIVVEPAEPVLQEGDQVQLKARLFSAAGTELEGRSVFWASEDPNVASLSDAGMLHGVARGTTRVAASAEGTHAFTEVRVVPVPVGSVSVSPSSVRLDVEESESLQAVVRDERGTVVTDRELTWVSASTSVATVNGSGVVTGVRPGRTTVTASAEGVSGTAEVQVTSGPPATIAVVSGNAQVSEAGRPLPAPLVIRVTDAQQNPVPEVVVTWAADHGTVTPLDERTDENGEASASWTLGSSTGEQRVTATVGSVTAAFTATAGARAVDRVEVSPASVTLAPLGTRQLQATARDDEGNSLSGRSVTWESSSTRVATVSSSGMVRALRPGQAVITATIEGVDGTSNIRVNHGQVSSLEVVAGNGQEAMTGAELDDPLVVRVTDDQGNTIPEVEVEWSAEKGSVSPSVAPTDETGRASARWTLGGTAGEQLASAKVGELTALFSAVAKRPAAATIAVSPRAVELQVEETRQLSVVVRDASGATIGDPDLSWSSSASGVARVSSGGRVTAVSPGTASITAASGDASDSAVITVSPGPPAALVVVSGNGQDAEVGSTLGNPLVAKVSDSHGNPVPDATIQWTAVHGSVSPTSAATGSTGEASTSWTLGNTAGEQRATATLGNLSASFTATASAPPPPPTVASVQVSPDTAVIPVQGTRRFEAVALDQGGAVLTGRSITWTSSAPSVAEVDQEGLVTGKSTGTVSIRATIDEVQGTAGVLVVPGLPTSITVVSGVDQEAVKSTTLPEPIVVEVTDALGNGVPGVSIQWSANRGGTVSPSSTTTNSSGRAAAFWTLGEPVGEHTATASTGQLSVSITATSLPPSLGDEEPTEPDGGPGESD